MNRAKHSTLHIRLTPDVKERLDRLADERRESMSVVARAALLEYLRTHDPVSVAELPITEYAGARPGAD